MHPKGFTLIELLVVIVIISVLAFVGITSFIGVTKGAKDTQRRVDIDAIAKALEVNNPFSGYPPQLQDSWFATGKIPTPPEGGSYSVIFSQNTGFQACATLSNNTTYCKPSSQITYVAPTPNIYSQSFTSGVPATTQCTEWNNWRALLTGTYTTITLKGSNDATGVSCTGATANTICQNLRTGTAMASISCGGRNWGINTACSLELTANGDFCQCGVLGYVARPCIGNSNWGSIRSDACSPPNQTITVVCQ